MAAGSVRTSPGPGAGVAVTVLTRCGRGLLVGEASCEVGEAVSARLVLGLATPAVGWGEGVGEGARVGVGSRAAVSDDSAAAVAAGSATVAITAMVGGASGRFTVIFRKTAAGWRIVHDHTSAD